MTIAALILPLVAQTAPAITVQLRTFEVPSDIPIQAASLSKLSERGGNAIVVFNPSAPTERQLEEKAKRGEVKALSSPVLRTLSGQPAQVEMRQETEGAATTQTIKVLPTLAKNGSITLDLSAKSITTTREETREEVSAFANFATRQDRTVYILAPTKADRKRSLLIAVRVSAS